MSPEIEPAVEEQTRRQSREWRPPSPSTANDGGTTFPPRRAERGGPPATSNRSLTWEEKIHQLERDLQKTQSEHEKVKAINMHGMVEKLKGLDSRLMFLTGEQANLINRAAGSIDRLLIALGIRRSNGDRRRAQLVINLLESGGFQPYTTHTDAARWVQLNQRWAPGIKHGSAPFTTWDEQRKAHAAIDAFVASVLLPLASQTHAVVICSALQGACVLSEAFMRIYRLSMHKWGSEPPFTILSTTNDIKGIYRSTPEGKGERHWQKVRAGSRVWRKHHAEMQARYVDTQPREKGATRPKTYWDLDPNATTYVIVDEGAKGQGTYNELLTQIMSTLANEVPSIAMKTGFSQKRSLSAKSALTLDSAVDVAMSGTPVLFLDVRHREALELPSPPPQQTNSSASIPGATSKWGVALSLIRGAKDTIVGSSSAHVAPDPAMSRGDGDGDGDVEGGVRARTAAPEDDSKGSREGRLDERRPQLIEAAKEAYKRLSKELWNARKASANGHGGARHKLVETFDACTLAFFHEALVGDGDSSTAELNYGRRAVSSEGSGYKTLFEAINELEASRENGEDLIRDPQDASTIRPASQLEISALSAWLAKRIFRDAWRALPREERARIHQKEKRASEARLNQEEEGSKALFRMSLGAGGGDDAGDSDDSDYESGDDDESVRSPPADMYREERYAFENQATTLLESQDFYHLNLRDEQNATKLGMLLMKKLVKLDRLPSQNSIEGCKLLQRAWCLYDVAMLLAGRYKRTFKIIFVTQLVCAWCAVAAASMSQVLRTNRLFQLGADEQDRYASILIDLAFITSVAGSVLTALDGLLKAKSRWRELRSTANAIESVVWQFRTRTGLYALPETQGKRQAEPRTMLENTLQELSKDLVSGNAVTTAGLAKRYPLNVYKHGQFQNEKDYEAPSLLNRLASGFKWLLGLCGLHNRSRNRSRMLFERFDKDKNHSLDIEELLTMVRQFGIQKEWSEKKVREIFQRFDDNGDGALDFDEFSRVVKVLFPFDVRPIDDFQSPASAPRYIELRINPQIILYQRRIPATMRRHLFYRILIILLGTCAAVLAHYDVVWCVVLTTAASSNLGTWQEFSAYDKKSQKYTRAVTGLNDILTWWYSLSEFEQASKYQIEALVSKTEAVIAEEQGTSKWANPARVQQEMAAKQDERTSPHNGGGGGHVGDDDMQMDSGFGLMAVEG